MIQIQDNGTGIRVRKTSERQDVCVLRVLHLQEVVGLLPVLETLGFYGWDCLKNKYLLSTYSMLGTVQENKEVKERVMKL